MQILDDMAGWDGTFPVGLILPAPDAVARRAALRALIGHVLGAGDVTIEHAEGQPPRLVRPGAALILSSASRDGLAAFAAGWGAIGVDVERVDRDAPVPFGVLHPAERAVLDLRPEAERAGDFAALWACKEAYLKALGVGLAQEPASVCVTLVEHGPPTFPHAEVPAKAPLRGEPQSLAGHSENSLPRHAEEARYAPSRSTHDGRAYFETRPMGAPQHDEGGECYIRPGSQHEERGSSRAGSEGRRRPVGAVIRDGAKTVEALLTWRRFRDSDYVIALVALPDQPTIGSTSTA